MKISLIMSTWKRHHLLKWGLESLSKQKHNHEFELILLNDNIEDDKPTKDLYLKYKDILNIRYFHTGASKETDIRREQCFALNFGIKQATGDVLVLTCPEMYHLSENNLNNLVQPFYEGKRNILTTPIEPKDDGRNFLKELELNGKPNINLFNSSQLLSNLYNFFMGFWMEDVINMGGFDEDFTGWAYDDTDFVNRLLDDGSEYEKVDIDVIHLWHPRGKAKGPGYAENIAHNKKLFEDRRGIIKRNQSREWGIMDL